MTARPVVVVGALITLAIAACGDPDTYDDRGYTKAPLERPGVVVRGEEPSPMRDYGEPVLPPREPLELPDSASQ